jgi:5-methylcytosine-specific restriction enzyme B
MMAQAKSTQLKPLYDAASLFVARVLKTRDSLFTPGRPIWSDGNLQDLYQRFVEHPDSSSDPFDTKLQRQLAGAPADTIQLAGELLYIHLLPGCSTSASHKRSRINTVLGWSPGPVTIPPELDHALEKGLIGEGMGFKVHRPFLLRYLIEFVQKWWALGASERAGALEDPWAFKAVAASVTVPKSHMQAELLLHLVHPDTFEDIMSRDHKRQIAEAFDSLVSHPTDDVDRKLLQIRRKLTEREGREISFYEPRILVIWKPEADPWSQFVKFAGLFYRAPRFDKWERDYKLRLAERARPIIAALSDRPNDTFEEFHEVLRAKDQNIVRWQDYQPFVEWYRKGLPESYRAVCAIRDAGKPVTERVRVFLQHLPKDVVKSPASRTTLASLFLSASDPTNLIEFRRRPFDWAFEQVGYPRPADAADEADRYAHALAFCDRFMNEASQRSLKLRDRLDAQGLVWSMVKWDKQPEGVSQADWDDFLQYRGVKPVLPADYLEQDEDGESVVAPPPPGTDLVVSDPIGRLVLNRKNVVLYGPPGTGKTHASLTLAEKWRRTYGEGSVLQVTFHPSFAYEDFIEGFRPDTNGRFERRDGIFVQACDRAHKEPARPLLLVIDELNRGDVARLFGELITLIEPDKRHSGVSRTLPYSQRLLWVPPNLHLLGTMNTADRSISLLDVGIRRRFCFKEYRPDSLAISTSGAHHREVAGVPLGELMDALNQRLSAVGVHRDRAIGHSHFLIASSETRPLEALRDRFRFDVIPLVEEYCYADRGRLRQVFDQLVTEEGSADDEVLDDDAEFAAALRRIVHDTRGTSTNAAPDTEE